MTDSQQPTAMFPANICSSTTDGSLLSSVTMHKPWLCHSNPFWPVYLFISVLWLKQSSLRISRAGLLHTMYSPGTTCILCRVSSGFAPKCFQPSRMPCHRGPANMWPVWGLPSQCDTPLSFQMKFPLPSPAKSPRTCSWKIWKLGEDKTLQPLLIIWKHLFTVSQRTWAVFYSWTLGQGHADRCDREDHPFKASSTASPSLDSAGRGWSSGPGTHTLWHKRQQKTKLRLRNSSTPASTCLPSPDAWPKGTQNVWFHRPQRAPQRLRTIEDFWINNEC